MSGSRSPFPARRGWGGARAGAGRKRGPNPGVPHASRTPFRRLPAHVTLRLRSDAPSLRTVPIVHEVERTFAVGRARPGFRLVPYSLQGNHAHLIVEAADRDALGRGMKAIGARLARAVNRVAGRTGRVFAERYHHRVLPTPKEVHAALRYVLLNDRKHASSVRANGTERPRSDPASSGRWFDGWKRKGPAPSHGRERAIRTFPPVGTRARDFTTLHPPRLGTRFAMSFVRGPFRAP